jgi:hypothetical protein
VIGKISDPRGTNAGGLLRYLYGPGRREEHADPHLVAGWRDLAGLEPELRAAGRRDLRRLAGLLMQPHAALGPRGFERPVWHCALRAAPEDRLLSDREWAELAADAMHRTGLAPRGQDDDAVRWVAVRHGADHIHVVAVLARQDGGRPRLSNERYRVREACRAAEGRYGLRRTAPGDRTAARRPSRAEREKARRRGRAEAPRVTLRRAVAVAAASASGEEQFLTRLAAAGVLTRVRRSTRGGGSEITGYAVALAGDVTKAGEPIWYGGGKLAADLTWPRLRRRWGPGGAAPDSLTAQDRSAIWAHAGQAAEAAATQIRALAGINPGAAADAAWAAADTLHVAAAVLGSRVLRQAADSYERAARPPFTRIPRPTPAGSELRQAARQMAAMAAASRDDTLVLATLVARLAALAEAVTELRRAQQHAAQAAAARQAAEQLRGAQQDYLSGLRHGPARPRTAAERARLDFPVPLRLTVSGRTQGEGSEIAHPRGAAPARPRGPTR